MNITYDLIAKRNRGDTQPDVLLYSSDNREEVIRYMKKYDKEYGFTLDYGTPKETPIATLLLRERTLTGKVLSEMHWHEIFDAYGERRGNESDCCVWVCDDG